MDIRLRNSYGHVLVFEAENVKVEEDIEERIYPKNEQGKPDFTKPPKRDIKTDAIEQFANILGDMIYYRSSDFDSSYLIEALFAKLPERELEDLLIKLKNQYE